jgi:hypothetical protein
VIPVLAGVVEDRDEVFLAVTQLDQFLEGLALQGVILLDETIEGRDVRVVVLP